MGRISREVMFMQMARVASCRSTCFRLNVGAIITRNHRPVSVGWNGAPSGDPHCAGNSCPGIVPGKCGTLHAEANAIDNAMGIEACDEGWNLYVTHSPCERCAEKIRDCGTISKVFFEVPYRKPDALYILQKAGIAVYEVTAAGYVIEYFSREVVDLP